MTSAGIRPYQPSDREAVRMICCETGYLGDPIDPHFSDRTLFADAITTYYTDHEPDWIWVAELDGQVVGYLTGCPDTERYQKTMSSEIVRPLIRSALLRGVLVRPGTAVWAWRGIFDMLRERSAMGFRDPRYPAHLHIDLLPEGRGLGLGGRLMKTYLDALQAIEVPGVHLETTAENTNAVEFFESRGFTRLREYPAPATRALDGSRLHGMVMVRSLEG